MNILSRVLNHNSDKNVRLSRISLSPVSLRGQSEDRENPFRLSIKLESPPIVLYGGATESSGSILSGVMTLEILDASKSLVKKNTNSSMTLSPVNLSASIPMNDVLLDSVTLKLVQTFHMTKPFLPSSSLILACKKCTTRKIVLAEWDVALPNCALPIGSYPYPFSHLLPGLLTASSKLGDHTSSTYIRYELIATAKSANNSVRAILPLEILRSILRGPDKNSLRVFPPTEVVTSAVLPGVMYPKSTLPVELRMENIVNESQTRRWRMRKLLWRLEESTQVKAYACEQHQSKLDSIKNLQKIHQETKTLRGDSNEKKSSRIGFDSSRISGLHHLTVQTLQFISRPPSTEAILPLPQSQRQREQQFQNDQQVTANQDTELPIEDVPTNRAIDEMVNFEEDFGTSSLSGAERIVANSETPISDPESSPDRRHFPEDKASSEDLYFDELRVIGHGELKSGWKSDFLGRGRIELILDVNILSCSTGTRLNMNAVSSDNPVEKCKIDIALNDANSSCDISDSVLGVYVSHLLVIEMIVAEELVSPPRSDALHPIQSQSLMSNNSSLPAGIPTGAARVLRMQFKISLTERSGLGIAWDDEVPPTYHDVKALSPPSYVNLTPPSSLVGISLSTPNPSSGIVPMLLEDFRPVILTNLDLVTGAEELIQELNI